MWACFSSYASTTLGAIALTCTPMSEYDIICAYPHDHAHAYRHMHVYMIVLMCAYTCAHNQTLAWVTKKYYCDYCTHNQSHNTNKSQNVCSQAFWLHPLCMHDVGHKAWGCSWQQSGKALNKTCSSTGSKGTAMQKPGNNAKAFG
jgi:hypothetical protein